MSELDKRGKLGDSTSTRPMITVECHRDREKLLCEIDRLNDKLKELQNRLEGVTADAGTWTATEKATTLQKCWEHRIGTDVKKVNSQSRVRSERR